MKTYRIEGWFRFGKYGDEKDFEVETIEAVDSIEAIKKFQEMFESIRFLTFYVDGRKQDKL
tara:strand:+ start:424 stop:606 length:183 start_codon:yes stop_codon:yes gene_type:complete